MGLGDEKIFLFEFLIGKFHHVVLKVVGGLALNLKAFDWGGGGDGEVAADDVVKVSRSEGEGLSSTEECNDGNFAVGQFAQLLGFLEETLSSL